MDRGHEVNNYGESWESHSWSCVREELLGKHDNLSNVENWEFELDFEIENRTWKGKSF